MATGTSVPHQRRAPEPPGTSKAAQRAFLDRHTPGSIVLAGRIDPFVRAMLTRSEAPAIWLDATVTKQRRFAVFGRPDTLPIGQPFQAILTAPGPDAERLARERETRNVLETLGYLQASTPPLPYPVSERDGLAAMLGGRPVWLAAAPVKAEIPALLRAHRAVLGQSHRLLLVLTLPPRAAAAQATALQADGWHVALGPDGDLPAPEVQIFIAETPDDLGLWYRLAPIAFLGGTLTGPQAQRPPFEAAALGSALLHGPKTTPFESQIQRLTRAGAARHIDQDADLERALTRLLSADVAARMATAGWDVVTEGAPAMNRAAELIEALLDGALSS